MKLIMENWKVYLQEIESIKINEEGKYGPTFLRTPLDENLEESDQSRDPESLSVEELEKMPAKDIQKAYSQMSGVEPSRSEPRRKISGS